MSEHSEHRPQTPISGAIFGLLVVIPIFAVIAYGAVEPWAFGIVAVLTGLMGVLWFADGIVEREVSLGTSPVQIPLWGLVLLGIIQLLPLKTAPGAGVLTIPAASSLSINPYATKMFVVQLVIFGIYFAAAQTYVNSALRLRRIVVIMIVFGGVMAFLGILQSLASADGIYGWRPTPQALPFASFVNRHHFAAFMEMTIALTLSLLVGKGTEKDSRLLLVIALVLMGIAVVFTGSRGGFLSLLAVVVFVFAANYLREHKAEEEGSEREMNSTLRRRLGVVGATLGVIVLIAGSVLMLGGDASLTRTIGFAGNEDVSNGRLHFWGIALRIFKDNPIIGTGLDTFGTAFPAYDSWSGLMRVEQSHNDYLQTLADGGILGLACVIAFIYFLFQRGFRRLGHEHSHYRRAVVVGGLAGCLGVLVHSFFDFPLRTSANAFFFLLCAVFATAHIQFPKKMRKR